MSASGLFFESEGAYTPGGAIRFAIEIETPGGKMVLSCCGEIVRVEPLQTRLGVAVRILDSMLRPS